MKNRKRQGRRNVVAAAKEVAGKPAGVLQYEGRAEQTDVSDAALDEASDYLQGPLLAAELSGANAVAPADEGIDVSELLIGAEQVPEFTSPDIWEGYELGEENEPDTSVMSAEQLAALDGPGSDAEGESVEQLGEDEFNDDDDGDDGDDGDEEDDDDDELTEEETLFNIACAAIEQGRELDWTEVIAWVVAAPVADMRLGLLCGMLIKGEPECSGARVLALLTSMGMGELVSEAQASCGTAVVAEPNLEDLSEQPRRASELRAASGTPEPAEPMKASELRAASEGGKQAAEATGEVSP